MPRGSMLKYFQERGGNEHGGPLQWPGTIDGYPVRGGAGMDLRQDEFDEIELGFDFYSSGFKLWIPEEKRRFDEVMDRIANGWYQEKKRIDRWLDGEDGPRVWLEWVQIYGEAPTAKTPGMARQRETTITDPNAAQQEAHDHAITNPGPSGKPHLMDLS